MSDLDGEKMRLALLSAIDEKSDAGPANLQASGVLQRAEEILGIKHNPDGRIALLALWNDMFRQGQIGWGNTVGLAPPYCHVTARGREMLGNVSRDPANPDGYLRSLRTRARLSPTAEAYMSEALQAYNSNCFKAAAVMVGCAAESLSLELRDAIVKRLRSLGATVPAKLTDWQLRKVLTAIKALLDVNSSRMPVQLRESYEAYWPAFVHQIRATRNDAGHPANIGAMTPDAVHGALLVFPELAALSVAMKQWVRSHLK